MSVDDKFLEKVKLYCKVDFDFDDDILKTMILSAQDQICFAIDKEATAETFKGNPRFELAVLKQVKEEYEHRGLSADTMRYPLANGVLNIIHQLRLRGDE